MTVEDGTLLRVAARQTGTSGQDIINIFHYSCAFTVSQADADVLEAVRAHIDTHYAFLNTLIAATYNPLDIKVDKVQFIGGVETVVGNVGTILWTGSYNPAGSGDDMAPGNAGLVKLLTGYGKQYARKFIAGLLESHGVSGFIDAAMQTGLANFGASALTTKVITAGNLLVPGIMSKKAQGFLFTVSSVVSAVVAYQRRRKPYVGS